MRNLLLSLMLLYMARGTLLAQNCSINAGINSTICSSESMKLYGTRSGLFSPNSTSKWTQISGAPVIIIQPDSLITAVNYTISGTYFFQLSNKCQDGINSIDTVSVIVFPLTKANAGKDTLLCPSSIYTLEANRPLNSNETGKWTIITNNGSVVIDSLTNPNSTLKLTRVVSGVSQLRWTIINSNGCVSYDDVLITNCGGLSPVNAGPDQVLDNCYVGTMCAKLVATNGGTGFGGQNGVWTVVLGPNISVISSPNNSTTNVCNLIPGIYIFRYTVSGPCANGFDEVMITVPPPSQNIPSVNPGNSFAICDMTSTITLNGNIPNNPNQTVQWIQTAGPATVNINTPNNPSTIVTGIIKSGKYSFSYSIKNNTSGCMGIGIITVTKYQTGTIKGGPDQILPCNITEAVIPTITTGYGSVTYKIISGPAGAFIYPTKANNTNTISGLTFPGTYRVEITYQFGTECSATSDFVDITVSRPPTGANAGSYQNFTCAATTTQLAGNNPVLTGLGSGRWSQISGPNTANLVKPNNFICDVTGTIPGAYIFRWTISGGNGCLENQDDITVVAPGNTVTKANAGLNRYVCSNSPFSLQGNVFRADETAKWIASPNNIAFTPNNSIANPVISNLQPNTAYTFIYAITNSCGSVSRDSVKITTGATSGPSAANAGTDQCLLENTNTIQLNAITPTSGTGKWTLAQGAAVSFTNSTLYNTTVNGIKKGTYKFVWTISVDGCSNTTTDTVIITVSGATTKANAGLDVVKCTDSYTLNANTPISGTGFWSQISGDGSAVIASPTNPNSTVKNLKTGLYTFRWTITNGVCSSNADDVIISISSPPSTANAGLDQNLCASNAASATLQAVAPTSGVGQWVWVTGNTSSPVIKNSTSSTATVAGLSSGSHTFRWIVSGGAGCPQSTDDVVIKVDLPANAGADDTLCWINNITLNGNAPTNGIGKWTQISGPNTIVFEAINNPKSKVTGLIAGTYKFLWTISNSFCNASSDEVQITILNNPDIAFAGNNQTTCSNAVVLSAKVPSTTNKCIWIQLTGPTTAKLSSNTNPTCTVNNLVAGSYKFLWKIYNERCYNLDTVEIIVNSSVAVNAGNDFTLCNSIKSIPLSGSSVSGFTTKGAWSIVSGKGTLSNTNLTDFPNTVTFSPDENYAGIVVLRLTANDACKTVTDDITISVEATNLATKAIHDSVSTELNTSVKIDVLNNDIILNNDKICDDAIVIKPIHGTATVNSDGSISYQPITGFTGIDSFNYKICSTTKEERCYINGKDNAWVFVTIEGCIFPNAFSPDGDGINDVFEIPCAQGDMQFTVFNRSGIEVYKNDLYTNDWNGTYNGSPLPDGTYYYMLKYSTDKINKLSKNGFITLRR